MSQLEAAARKPLNPQQQAAVDFGTGPLLILAGAGSGKTEVLTRRYLSLIERGEVPERILLLTFTNKAANNAKARAARQVGIEPRRIWAMTFHAFGVRVLRTDGERVGLRPGFSIYDSDDQERVLKGIIADDLELDPKRVKPAAIAGLIARLKTELVDAAGFVSGRYRPGVDVSRVQRIQSAYGAGVMRLLEEIYPLYEKAMAQRNAIDFGDCLLKAVTVLQTHADVHRHWADRFRYVMVDEYQDTNRAQYMLVRLVASGHGNITVVGDPEQTIMSFQGADRRNLLSFKSDFPGAHEIHLTHNYRSTTPILAAANAVRASGGGDGLKLQSVRGDGVPLCYHVGLNPAAEADFVVRRIEEGIRAGRSPGEFAILYRTHALSRPFEERLARSQALQSGIPYVVIGGLRFTDRLEVRDLVAYLRLYANPRDMEAFRRAVQVPRRGIGAKAIAAVMQQMAANPDLAALDALLQIHLPASARAGAERMVALYREAEARAAAPQPISQLVDHFLHASGYWDLWEQQAQSKNRVEQEEAQERLDNLQQLVALAAEMDDDGAEFTDFLVRVALSASGEEVKTEEAVKLQTLHSAKGLEFPTVFLVALEDNILPFYRAQEEDPECEEERRLFYVGITRAERELYLTRTHERPLRNREGDGSKPSRYLSVIPPEIMEEVFW